MVTVFRLLHLLGLRRVTHPSAALTIDEVNSRTSIVCCISFIVLTLFTTGWRIFPYYRTGITHSEPSVLIIILEACAISVESFHKWNKWFSEDFDAHKRKRHQFTC